jgi:hypothetical protein
MATHIVKATKYVVLAKDEKEREIRDLERQVVARSLEMTRMSYAKPCLQQSDSALKLEVDHRT